MKTFSVSSDNNLKTFTDEVFPQGAFYLSRLLREREIKVNGARVDKNIPLKAGDTVVYYTSPAQEAKPSHDVIFEDCNVLIADKFSGVTCEGLSRELGEGYIPVHRLDRNTVGLLIYAKNSEAERELSEAFKERRVEKIYNALCKDNFKAARGELKAYLKKYSDRAEVEISDSPRQGFETILTDYEVVESLGDIARVKITLHTGKTHQIRAHMAHIGCPVLGDNKYGDTQLNKKYKLSRQQLIAKELTLFCDGKLSYLRGKTFKSKFNAVINN